MCVSCACAPCNMSTGRTSFLFVFCCWFFAPLAPLSIPRSISARVARCLSGIGGSAFPLPGLVPPYCYSTIYLHATRRSRSPLYLAAPFGSSLGSRLPGRTSVTKQELRNSYERGHQLPPPDDDKDHGPRSPPPPPLRPSIPCEKVSSCNVHATGHYRAHRRSEQRHCCTANSDLTNDVFTGLSLLYPGTVSTGNWYRMAVDLFHIRAAAHESWCALLQPRLAQHPPRLPT